MSSARVVLLAVTVEGPELPPADHLDRRVAVCFCGRPVGRWRLNADDRIEWVGACEACGWAPPWERRREQHGYELGDAWESDPPAPDLMALLESSLADLPARR